MLTGRPGPALRCRARSRPRDRVGPQRATTVERNGHPCPPGEVAADLAADHRVITPTLPYGSHTVPLRPDADLTPHSTALLIGEFADTLDLPGDTVFVENDAGRLQQLAAERPERLGRMVIAGCEAFDNYPPKAGGTMMAAAAKIPGGIRALALALTPRPPRRIPGTGFAVMTVKGVPHELTDAWLAPLRTDSAVRSDLVKYLRATRRTEMLEAAGKLAEFPNPALVVWGRQDKMMPLEHGRRLAELIPGAELLELDVSPAVAAREARLRCG